MNTTIELSFAELCLICEMASQYSKKIDERINDYEYNDIYEKMGINTDEFLKIWKRKQKETMDLWKKMEEAESKAVYGEAK